MSDAAHDTRARFDADSLRRFAREALVRAGATEQDARKSADVLVWASLRGVDTHGIRNLKRYYVDGLTDGTINPRPEWRVLAESETTARVDADGGLGLSAACRGTRLAIRKAEAHGVGIVTVRNSQHLGAAGYYAWLAAEAGMIGLSASAYLFPHGQKTAVLPFGGTQPMLSTNPLAFAAPCDEQPPFVLDMSTSITPVNRLELWHELGRAIPQGWALAADGRPTTSPEDVHALLPLGGPGPYGGHKGFGLAVALQILCGVLSGAWCENAEPERLLGDDRRLADGYGQEGNGHAFAAIRIDRFLPADAFRRAMDAMVRTLNASPADAETGRVLVAGQLEAETERERRARGIPVDDHVVRHLEELAERYRLPPPQPASVRSAFE